MAASLSRRGVNAGSVVALLAPNSPSWVTVFHGALRTGAAVTAMSLMATADDAAKQLTDSRAEIMFTTTRFQELAEEAARQSGLSTDRIVLIDGELSERSLASLLAELRTPVEVEIDAVTHIAVLAYSSGTTGVPKAVMLTHRNLVANLQQLEPLVLLAEDDRLIAVLPFFHIYGMTVLMNYAFHTRTAVVTMPRFDLEQFLRTVAEHRCTYLHIAPPIVLALAKHPLVDEFDLSHVHTLFSGAAPLDAKTASLAAARIGATIGQGYGMSEFSPASHVCPSGVSGVPLDSVGMLAPCTIARIVDIDTGLDVVAPTAGYSAPGELLIAGPQVMLGYAGNPEATAAVIDADGFLHTGDVAVVHHDGYYTIIDRVKELVKYKGYQVPPAELEAVLLSHPEIDDAAVIASYDDEGQEIPKAFVVCSADADLNADDVMTYVAARVAPYKKVRSVEFINEIPKSAAGKILRKDLRARDRSTASGSQTSFRIAKY